MEQTLHKTLTLHTTEDEIAYLRGLECSGKRHLIISYRQSLHLRSWHGPGMSVDVEVLKLELKRILGKEQKGEQTDERAIIRKANEWLAGGALRAIAQGRKDSDKWEI